MEEYEENIKRLHDKGIRIFGSFIVGLDDDEESVFDDIYEFCCRNKIDFPIVNCLTPFRGRRPTVSCRQKEGLSTGTGANTT